MRVRSTLFGLGLLAAFALPAFGQEGSPVTATVEDVERVYLTFETIDRLADRCAIETQDGVAFETARQEWMSRNERTQRLADTILTYLEASIDIEALAPRAEADTDALLDSIVTKPELCRNYLDQLNAGEMDLKRVVPDLYNRLLASDGAIAALQRKS